MRGIRKSDDWASEGRCSGKVRNTELEKETMWIESRGSEDSGSRSSKERGIRGKKEGNEGGHIGSHSIGRKGKYRKCEEG